MGEEGEELFQERDGGGLGEGNGEGGEGGVVGLADEDVFGVGDEAGVS